MQDGLKISPAGLMDLPNAALYLGVPVSTMRWLRRMHKLPFLTLGGRLMVTQKDLDEYIERIKEPIAS